jgi:hypothetical protein
MTSWQLTAAAAIGVVLCSEGDTLARATAQPAPVVPGTYKIGVCPGPCNGDSADVRGWLIITEGQIDTSAFSGKERRTLLDNSMSLLHPNLKPNACFVLETVKRDTKLLAGLIKVGLTRWDYADGVLSVTLYRSPDASSVAAGVVNGDEIVAGETEEARIRGSSRFRRSFLAGRRVGDPDLEVCRQGVTAETAERER